MKRKFIEKLERIKMADSEKVVQNKITLITAMGKSKDKKDDRGWPWLDGDPDPTDNKVIEKIVYWFPYYAVYGKGKLYSGNEDEKRIARTFLACCEYGSVVRNYFKENANHIDTKEEARNIADRALDLVDEFYDWFQKKEQGLESYNKLSWSWRKEFRRFNMCMNSDKHAKKPGETKQDIPPAKRWGIGAWLWKFYEVTVKSFWGPFWDKVLRK